MLKLLIREPKIKLVKWEIKTVKCVPYYLVHTKDICYLSYLTYIWADKKKAQFRWAFIHFLDASIPNRN